MNLLLVDKRTSVRYYLITNKGSEGEQMKRIVEAKNLIFPQLLNDFTDNVKNDSTKLYPEMPERQIQHYIKLSNRKSEKVVIQLKPSIYSNEFTEAIGKIALSPNNEQIILTSPLKKTVHLIQMKQIHHIRLAK